MFDITKKEMQWGEETLTLETGVWPGRPMGL
jgi:hypothetical protein